ncbi:uroporphyrinogen-III C-methyltransferase [Geminicoccus roseus]|uniref:uroporphyrinogen-III C-methyltransferase n=1 Tax=Geminicoccus roseus TaxID=404900 RepID=UPI000422FFAD|nr:uroporphyrinogen-III C-methyltransferase [Geminicoccus roseus]
MNEPVGKVYLVGAGPGDPELLTLKALRVLQSCDVIVHDRLIAPELMEMVPPHVERIFAGKRRDFHFLPQNDINQLLVELAKAGRTVVRLKGGDPFVFGRGGEELETLVQAGIPFEVVPGVSAANGVGAYAGIPLTHRDHAQSVLFVTGHTKNGEPDLNWTAICQPRQTIVIYMGLKPLKALCAKLVQHGLGPDLPAAAIESGTLPEQRVVTGTLATLPELAASVQFDGPVLVIVGSVVGLRDQLAWFDRADAPAGRERAAELSQPVN